MEEIAPPALVLGCNTPHGIGVLSDWIEEQIGYAPDFTLTGYGDGLGYSGIDPGNGLAYVDNYAFLNGDGQGNAYERYNFNGASFGRFHGASFGRSHGDGNGYGFGDGDGCGYGFGFTSSYVWEE